MARRRLGRYDPVGQVGWLFADLLLGLAMLYFAVGTSAAPPPEPTATSVAPTATPTPEPTVAPSPTPATRPCLDKQAVEHTLQFNAAALDSDAARATALDDLQQRLSALFAEQIADGHDAGIVLTFGGTLARDPSTGNRHAGYVNEALRRIPNFAAAAHQEYHDLGAPPGTAVVQVYFLSRC